MDPLSALGTILSQPVIAAYGPWGVVALIMGLMLYSWLRGREDRMAKLNDAYASSLREDQRELFERQAGEIEALKVDKKALEMRLKATEVLCQRLRMSLFDMYLLCRTNTHAATNAQAVLLAAGLKTKADLEPIVLPEVPQAGSDLD